MMSSRYLTSPLRRMTAGLGAGLLLSGLLACSSNNPKPAALEPVVPLLAVQQVWTTKLGAVEFPLSVGGHGNQITVASSSGLVTSIEASSGRELWRAELGRKLSAGVGSDGQLTAVVTQANELIALQQGREIWRQVLKAQAFTAPFVAGGRVFLLAADRSVNAFDGASGTPLWTQQRTSEPLVLKQAGVMLAVGDTLVVGMSGRLVGLNPLNGSVRWEAALATPRGVNDVERLVDLVGPASRINNSVCVRAFQASVGCVDAVRGLLQWSRPADGSTGLDGQADAVYGTESDGKVVAWRRQDGERLWVNETFRNRVLTAPRVLGRSIAFGDAAGLVHVLSRQDGAVLNRLPTDGSGIAATPALLGDTLVVVTRAGNVYGFRPQ
jgi:outer membrane protein assembly factor BamB